MYKNKANERNNICGTKVRFFRKQFATKTSQKKVSRYATNCWIRY